MPEICRFFGIVITMYFNDHPPPHFHVRFQGFRAQMEIATLELLEGDLPPKELWLVRHWAGQHQKELQQNWDDLQKTGRFVKIEPLD
jgi:hypothetical protein